MLPKCLSLFIATLIVAARPASATNCSDLVGVSIPDVTVTSATNVAAGQFTPPASANALETAGFCRVVAVAKPTSDSIINFEVWIPSGERWNHDFLGVGNGGYNGVIQYESLAGALNRGFGAASTDTGHTGADEILPLRRATRRRLSIGHRAIHVVRSSLSQRDCLCSLIV